MKNKPVLYTVLSLCVLFIILPCIVLCGVYFNDKVIDPCQFPDMNEISYTDHDGVTFDLKTKKLSNEQKGILLTQSIVAQLKHEMYDTTYGWSLNDCFLSISNPTLMDNRANRQDGVREATFKLMNKHINTFTNLGENTTKNKYLKKITDTYLSLNGEWGFWSVYDENYYKKAFENLDKYYTHLLEHNDNESNPEYQSFYNAQTRDFYSMLIYINGDDIIDYAKGKLKPKMITFTTIDDNINSVRGQMLVLRDYLNTMFKEYPELIKPATEQNMKRVFTNLNIICNYNELVLLPLFNQQAVIYQCLTDIEAGLKNIADSLRT